MRPWEPQAVTNEGPGKPVNLDKLQPERRQEAEKAGISGANLQDWNKGNVLAIADQKEMFQDPRR